MEKSYTGAVTLSPFLLAASVHHLRGSISSVVPADDWFPSAFATPAVEQREPHRLFFRADP